MYGNLASVYGLNGIPNMIIDRLEIIKGPSSTLYGSEAVAGVINIITKNPEDQPFLSLDVQATSHLESYVNMALTKSASTTFANKASNKKIIDFIRAYSVPTPEVNRSLAYYMDESGGDMEATAKNFLQGSSSWTKWVPADVAKKVKASL